MEGSMIVSGVISFVIVAIILMIGVTILGSTSTGFDCSSLQGFDITKGASSTLKDNVQAEFPAGTWAGQCWATQESVQQSYALLVIILVIIAAAAILMVVRYIA